MKKVFVLSCLCLSFSLFSQNPVNLSSPVTLKSCADKTTNNFPELKRCFTSYLSNEVAKSINSTEIMNDVPHDLQFTIFYHVATNAMIHRDSTVLRRHSKYTSVIGLLDQQIDALFNRINQKTKAGTALVAAKNKNGELTEEKSSLPLTLVSVGFDDKEIKKQIEAVEKEFQQKAIFAQKEGEHYVLFYQSTRNSTFFTYQLDPTTKQVTFLKEYADFKKLLEAYPNVEEGINQPNYTLSYFFYKEYDFMYEIQKKEENYLVLQHRYKTPSINMIFENLLSIYHSYFQYTLLKN
ncbi:hypothetical protein [Flavobacterium orientale]|uniref:Uncharacterized protein n=1 Tax=Flavobacterium orientale TaxID=1756020 RepID=A0A917DG02_9FLAO|nr:hypothetical protein [Flavobacterium orientale]GGD32712.1 hypothetical protein GCM10011343_23470 [Flavobacterium orientale]